MPSTRNIGSSVGYTDTESSSNPRGVSQPKNIGIQEEVFGQSRVIEPDLGQEVVINNPIVTTPNTGTTLPQQGASSSTTNTSGGGTGTTLPTMNTGIVGPTTPSTPSTSVSGGPKGAGTTNQGGVKASPGTNTSSGEPKTHNDQSVKQQKRGGITLVVLGLVVVGALLLFKKSE